MSERREHNINKLGQCLKMTRQMHGQTQASFAKVLSISPQQIQKYELGLNRIPADALLTLARELQIPIADFFPSDTSEELQGLRLTDDCLSMLQQLLSLDEKRRSLVVALVEQLTHSASAQAMGETMPRTLSITDI